MPPHVTEKEVSYFVAKHTNPITFHWSFVIKKDIIFDKKYGGREFKEGPHCCGIYELLLEIVRISTWVESMHLLLQYNNSVFIDCREVLTLMDGGVVALDWGVMSESSEGDDPGSGRDKPVLLILAGITGSSEETYIMHLVRDGLLTGYRPVVFNQRGYGGVPLKVRNTYRLKLICGAAMDY